MILPATRFLEAGTCCPTCGRLKAHPKRDRRTLTLREIEVVQGISEGKANKAIAADLFISEKTVKFHITSIFRKLHMVSRYELIREVLTDPSILREGRRAPNPKIG